MKTTLSIFVPQGSFAQTAAGLPLLYTAPIFDMLAGINAMVGKRFVFIDPE
jgi:hypothetical protein